MNGNNATSWWGGFRNKYGVAHVCLTLQIEQSAGGARFLVKNSKNLLFYNKIQNLCPFFLLRRSRRKLTSLPKKGGN